MLMEAPCVLGGLTGYAKGGPELTADMHVPLYSFEAQHRAKEAYCGMTQGTQ